MSVQNYKNHSRLTISYHGVLFILALIAVVCSIWFYTKYDTELNGCLLPITLIALSLGLFLLMFLARIFALKAQDRAIRAEENLRYFAITGNLLDSSLTIQQIVALRFAPNNEFVDLAEKAAKESLSPKAIKMSIQNWRGDTYRV